MRSHRLTSAVAAATGLLALVPAGAAAAHHRGTGIRHGAHAGACKLTLNVAPRLLTAGESALASGLETCGGAPAANQPVTLYERTAGTPGVAVAGTTTTNGEGRYQLPTAALTSNTAFYAAIGSTRSPERPVRVAAAVSLTGPPETKSLSTVLPTGRRNAVTFAGTVSPGEAGATVVLQRENALRGTEWHRIGKPVLVDGEGHFSITHAFVAPGPSSIRVVVRSNHRNVASASNVLSYVISQAQNPLLRIESSQDPLPFGGSATITGQAPGQAHAVVTLLARTARGHYTPIATATTDEQGRYSFPVQKPPVSMYYRVKSAARSSAVLYQGVKYVLTAAPSAGSVSSGQPLTFSGLVSPAKAGHTIYLERQNAQGTNFHVVAIGSVAADGSYSITRTFFAPGSYVLRVKIPGDSENGGTASTTFPTTVTPIASAKVPPESPGNGALPPEGQV
jgi:5-hydroxyisourate hydrolase-like protein (transthyretin family)